MSVSEPSDFLRDEVWCERVFNGDWIRPLGGTNSVREPAAGEVLTFTSLADAADIAFASLNAARAPVPPCPAGLGGLGGIGVARAGGDLSQSRSTGPATLCRVGAVHRSGKRRQSVQG